MASWRSVFLYVTKSKSRGLSLYRLVGNTSDPRFCDAFERQRVYFKRYVALVCLSLLLTGCMGIYEGGFECPAGTGVGCTSISDINTLVNKGEIPKVSVEKAPTPRPEIWYVPQIRDQWSNIRDRQDSPARVHPSIIKPQNQRKKYETQSYDAGMHHKSGIKDQWSGPSFLSFHI